MDMQHAIAGQNYVLVPPFAVCVGPKDKSSISDGFKQIPFTLRRFGPNVTMDSPRI